MTPSITIHTFLLLTWLSLLISLVCTQTCNTANNPTCNGNSKFATLCCNYPDICYWADRSGTPGCCPAGQTCGVNGGGNPPVTTQPANTGGIITQTVTGAFTPTTNNNNGATNVVLIGNTGYMADVPRELLWTSLLGLMGWNWT